MTMSRRTGALRGRGRRVVIGVGGSERAMAVVGVLLAALTGAIDDADDAGDDDATKSLTPDRVEVRRRAVRRRCAAR